MSKRTFFSLLALAVPALVAPTQAAADENQALAAFDFQQVIADVCAGAAVADSDVGGTCTVTAFTRRPITFDVAEYSVELRVGPEAHDVIGLHRVVRELSPNRPMHTEKAVMMAHGDIWGFDAAFLAGGSPESIPVYLAENGVDVWGIDFGWTLVPAGETDFSFMARWSVDRDIADLRAAIGVARAVRSSTQHDRRPFKLLGWSRGGQIGYGFLSEETQRPSLVRLVDGFIPVDIYLKTDDETLRARACARYADRQTQLAAGTYADSTGALVSTLGTLAIDAPSDPSFLIPSLTNAEVGLFAGAMTFALQGGNEPAPFYHFTGGVFDERGVPVDLAYTDARRFLELETLGAPYQPVQLLSDAEAALCDDPRVDVGFDDHLGEITTPVFYVGADGGFGNAGLYTTHLLASTDVSAHVVDLLPPEAQIAEIGHVDIFHGEDAEALFWQPILSWIQRH
jgi:hypothetical protein